MRATSFLAVLLVACGGKAAAPEAPRASASVAEEAPRTRETEPSTGNALSRAELDAVLDAGIAAFLSSVETDPEMAEGRFVGFRIVSFFPGDERFASASIRRGDVVVAVNGLAIERPDDLFRVWQELRVASELSVDLIREGQPRRLTYVIE